jgi:RNA-directed DNA polymerase
VFGIFRTSGYPEAVAHALTGLTTNVVPRSVWRAAPRPEGADALQGHYRLGRRLATPHLPQGAPTSPALANLCAHGLDRRLTGLAETFGMTYSRYADDVAFSGAIGPTTVRRIICAVTGIAKDEGFVINEVKTRAVTRSQRQRLAGVVINEHPNVSRSDYDTLRAILHNAARTSPAEQNRAGHAQFVTHLQGRVSWATALNPQRRRTLESLLNAAVANVAND